MVRRLLIAWLIVLLTTTLYACATPQTQELLESPPASLPSKALLTNVPFYPQQMYYCGPAALAMVLDYQGAKTSQEALARKLYVPKLKGTLQAEMLAAARSEGRLAYIVSPRLTHLLAEVAAGHPVIVLQNLGVNWYPEWHYAVVIGYNLDTQEIVLHSGKRAAYPTPLATFERTWARGKHWALEPLRPGELPTEDEPARILEAALDLEQTGQLRAAHKTYAALARRWPKNFIARMGVGNTSYALNQPEQAVHAFQAAARIRPDAAEAFNNLAVTLSELACRTQALQAARCAVALDGADNPAIQRTLQGVKAAPAQADNNRQCPAIDCRTGKP